MRTEVKWLESSDRHSSDKKSNEKRLESCIICLKGNGKSTSRVQVTVVVNVVVVDVAREVEKVKG